MRIFFSRANTKDVVGCVSKPLKFRIHHSFLTFLRWFQWEEGERVESLKGIYQLSCVSMTMIMTWNESFSRAKRGELFAIILLWNLRLSEEIFQMKTKQFSLIKGKIRLFSFLSASFADENEILDWDESFLFFVLFRKFSFTPHEAHKKLRVVRATEEIEWKFPSLISLVKSKQFSLLILFWSTIEKLFHFTRERSFWLGIMC